MLVPVSKFHNETLSIFVICRHKISCTKKSNEISPCIPAMRDMSSLLVKEKHNFRRLLLLGRFPCDVTFGGSLTRIPKLSILRRSIQNMFSQ